jgi:hypothetical protein
LTCPMLAVYLSLIGFTCEHPVRRKPKVRMSPHE